MRYHFNIRDGAAVIPDEEGAEFATLKAARAEARASVRDLASEDIRNGRAAHAWRVEITNRDGTVLDSIGLHFFENWIPEGQRPSTGLTLPHPVDGANKIAWERRDDGQSRAESKAYLVKAQQAEQEAAKTKDADARASWLRIAASYRQMAEQT